MCLIARREGTPVLLFLSQIKDLPAPFSLEQVNNGLTELQSRAESGGNTHLATFAQHLSQHPVGSEFLAALFGNSPFLTQCFLRDIAFVKDLMEQGPEEASSILLGTLRTSRFTDRAPLMKFLRETRTRVALMTAAADIANIWSLADVTGTLSHFADKAVTAAVDHLLTQAASAGEIEIDSPENPTQGSGFSIIGMGKLGANELNYSSDIDLVALFDQEVVKYTGRKSPQELFVRLTRDLVQILQSRTQDGYVFRTDLRLRPDTGSSPLAMSMGAAESYYESVGQNWERAALIKARPIAGDLSAGQGFLDRISPFVWRKYLDFAAIEDIHSIKRQIHAHRGHGSVTVPGHNVKLGRGGIREIEFFAQTQQLIAGGREPSLRVSETCRALRALETSGRIEQRVVDDLESAYAELRRLEHRLQMVADEQTQTLPESEEGIAHIATFLSYASTEAFVDQTLDTLRMVEQHYARLFEHAPALGDTGSLVFTGTEDDPDTIATLDELGYSEPSTIASLIRNWHHGRFRAMRSARARELLTELTPTLLRAFADTANPDAAVLKFDEFLAKLPAGVQIFSLFYANPGLLDLVAEIMGSAPRLAEHLARNSRLLDNVLSGDFYDPLPDYDNLVRELDEVLRGAQHYEEALDATRRWGHDQAFQAGVHILRNISSASEISPSLADVADVLVSALFTRTETEFARAHGRIPDASFAVVALGKYGSRELTPESDLDLTFIYDCPESAKVSDGERPLTVAEYYSRLSKRVINALAALTAEGRLYEVDMRLRPSGKSGPIAVHVDGFESYQRDQAWTWEHMALTKARVVVAPLKLRQRIDDIVRNVLQMPRDPQKLLSDVADMHERIEREYGTEDPWQIKHAHGGLFELEFICQYLILRHAHEHTGIVGQSYSDALRSMSEAGVISPVVAEELSTASRVLRDIQGFLRQTLQEAFVEDTAPEGLQQALATATGSADFAALRELLVMTERCVNRIYRELIGDPAGKYEDAASTTKSTS